LNLTSAIGDLVNRDI
jgi:hypothetical protein